jgi:PAS domain S-box-containing protein
VVQQRTDRVLLFIAIVEASTDAVITETLNGIIISRKPSAERLFGLTMQEAIGDIIIPDERRPEISAFWAGPGAATISTIMRPSA